MYSHCCSLLRKTKLQGERKRTQPAPGRYSHYQILHLWCSTITSSLLSAHVQLLRGLINTLIQVPAEDRRHTTTSQHLQSQHSCKNCPIHEFRLQKLNPGTKHNPDKKKCFEELQPGVLQWEDICVQQAESVNIFLFILLINTKWGLLRKNQQQRGRGTWGELIPNLNYMARDTWEMSQLGLRNPLPLHLSRSGQCTAAINAQARSGRCLQILTVILLSWGSSTALKQGQIKQQSNGDFLLELFC